MKIKNAIIFGDSYSTFRGFIPEEYDAYYSPDFSADVGNVNSVELTWWHRLSNELDFSIVRNDSWSGSTVAYASDNKNEKTYYYAYHHRLNTLYNEGFFEGKDIDTVFVFGGTNDSWRDIPLGEVKYDGFTESDLHCYCPSFAYMIKRLREIFPKANIISIINNELKPEIGDTVKAVSEHFGTHYVELHDIAKQCNHPLSSGMAAIAEQVKNYIENN